MLRKDLHEANRLSWNAATAAHNSHKRDQARFLAEGGTTLFPEEIDLLGDLSGKTLLHLQCNAGQDTLSLAARGARVTGVDISDEAIRFAAELAAQSGIQGTFVRSDLYDWLEQAPSSAFDVVFSSYGAIVWLSDLRRWGEGIHKVLVPGGKMVLVESHPTAMMFDENLTPKYDYQGGTLVSEPGVSDYVAGAGQALTPMGFEQGVVDFENPHPDHSFCWGMAEILMALTRPGLTITELREYPYTNGWRPFANMVELSGRRQGLPPGFPVMPLMFGLVAMKPR